MSDHSYSDESLSDDEEDLDPRIQDGLEKLNAATDGINHLEHELDEARAYFRQTLASAGSNLNYLAKKLGKCVEKARPFYESLRTLRQAHFVLQQAALQYERANGLHVAAKRRVREAEQRVFSSIEKRAFDAALQELLNTATTEVNNAEEMKRQNWKRHQEASCVYNDIRDKTNKLHGKLRKSIEKSKPYFELKVGLDRNLWQQKVRVDSIQKGLGQARDAYSDCLRSLEAISDEIHQKRKDKKMQGFIAKLQRGEGVGADSSDEASLTTSNFDLDLNPDEIDGTVQMLQDKLKESETLSLSEVDNVCAELQQAVVSQPGYECHAASFATAEVLERSVMGSETGAVSSARSILEREVDGLESENEDEDTKETDSKKLTAENAQHKLQDSATGEDSSQCQLGHTKLDQESGSESEANHECPLEKDNVTNVQRHVDDLSETKLESEAIVDKDKGFSSVPEQYLQETKSEDVSVVLKSSATQDTDSA